MGAHPFFKLLTCHVGAKEDPRAQESLQARKCGWAAEVRLVRTSGEDAGRNAG